MLPRFRAFRPQVPLRHPPLRHLHRQRRRGEVDGRVNTLRASTRTVLLDQVVAYSLKNRLSAANKTCIRSPTRAPATCTEQQCCDGAVVRPLHAHLPTVQAGASCVHRLPSAASARFQEVWTSPAVVPRRPSGSPVILTNGTRIWQTRPVSRQSLRTSPPTPRTVLSITRVPKFPRLGEPTRAGPPRSDHCRTITASGPPLTDQRKSTWPPARDKAPYFTAFVASSCKTMAIGCTA